MKVQIAETGVTETLDLTIGDSPTNWATDHILPYCPDLPHDRETDTYTMTADEYAYWTEALARYEAVEKAKQGKPELEQELMELDWNDLDTALDHAEKIIKDAE